MSEIRIKSSHPESQGEFVDIPADQFDPTIHELYDTSGPVEIPADWASLQWKRRVGLARLIVGGDEEITADQASEIIAAEVAKRAGQDA